MDLAWYLRLQGIRPEQTFSELPPKKSLHKSHALANISLRNWTWAVVSGNQTSVLMTQVLRWSCSWVIANLTFWSWPLEIVKIFLKKNTGLMYIYKETKTCWCWNTGDKNDENSTNSQDDTHQTHKLHLSDQNSYRARKDSSSTLKILKEKIELWLHSTQFFAYWE